MAMVSYRLSHILVAVSSVVLETFNYHVLKTMLGTLMPMCAFLDEIERLRHETVISI